MTMTTELPHSGLLYLRGVLVRAGDAVWMFRSGEDPRRLTIQALCVVDGGHPCLGALLSDGVAYQSHYLYPDTASGRAELLQELRTRLGYLQGETQAITRRIGIIDGVNLAKETNDG